MHSTHRLLKSLAANLVIALFAAAVALGGKGDKGKPGTQDPPPPGTIFFRFADDTYAMDADGNNKRMVPGVNGFRSAYSASSGVYGPDPQLDRLWLDPASYPDGRTYAKAFNSEVVALNTPPLVEIWAVFSSSEGDDYVKLTDFHGTILPIESGIYQHARWSSDGQDSFFSFLGYDLSDAYNAADDSIDFDKLQKKLFRVNVSGTQIAGEIIAGQWEPVTGDDSRVQEIGPYWGLHHWCPDGDRFVYTEDSPIGEERSTFVVDISDPQTPIATLLWQESTINHHFQWSPKPFSDGEYRLVFLGTDLGERGIYTIKPDGTQLTPVSLNSGRTFHFDPRWSTDNRHIVYATDKGAFGDNYSVYRIPTPGTGTSGNKTSLTGDLDSAVLQTPAAWVP